MPRRTPGLSRLIASVRAARAATARCNPACASGWLGESDEAHPGNGRGRRPRADDVLGKALNPRELGLVQPPLSWRISGENFKRRHLQLPRHY